jgi:hypothetical protein
MKRTSLSTLVCKDQYQSGLSVSLSSPQLALLDKMIVLAKASCRCCCTRADLLDPESPTRSSLKLEPNPSRPSLELS